MLISIIPLFQMIILLRKQEKNTLNVLTVTSKDDAKDHIQTFKWRNLVKNRKYGYGLWVMGFLKAYYCEIDEEKAREYKKEVLMN